MANGRTFQYLGPNSASLDVNMGNQPALVRLGGLEFAVIAGDGRPLPTPVVTTERLVAPGERYDLLVDLPATNRTATVDYFDIRMRRILGAVETTLGT